MVLPFLLNIHFLSILPYVLTLLAIAISLGIKYSEMVNLSDLPPIMSAPNDVTSSGVI
jgi:hypothetical protein